VSNPSTRVKKKNKGKKTCTSKQYLKYNNWRMALVLRIKFPPTYPLIYKTLRIDAKLTVAEAVNFISTALNIPAEKNMGLYLPDERKWLEDDVSLSQYESLQDVVSDHKL
jgi:hypothetical protein